jgi:hypothetical protein
VLLAVSKATGQDCACVPHIATGLQGGLGVGEVCGAVEELLDLLEDWEA